MALPAFRKDGTLPPGRRPAEWDEFCNRFGWNPRRQELLAGLKAALGNLKEAGCRRVFVDGSFVTAKEFPEDFDACWDLQGVNPKRLDPVLLVFGPGRAAQKAKFLGELVPAIAMANSRDTFIEFFQRDRAGKHKGIAVLDLRRLP